MSPRSWPDWWNWELEFSVHVEKRMVDRQFTETDLRSMLEGARAVRRDLMQGRWVVEARLHRRAWEVIVEPDARTRTILVITAYQVSS